MDAPAARTAPGLPPGQLRLQDSAANDTTLLATLIALVLALIVPAIVLLFRLTLEGRLSGPYRPIVAPEEATRPMRLARPQIAFAVFVIGFLLVLLVDASLACR